MGKKAEAEREEKRAQYNKLKVEFENESDNY